MPENDSFIREKKGRDSEAPANRPCPLDAGRVAPDGNSGHHHLAAGAFLVVPDYPVAPLLDFTRRPLRSVADKQENRTAETEAKNLQAASQARGSGYVHLDICGSDGEI
jgi:hypothetical protein